MKALRRQEHVLGLRGAQPMAKHLVHEGRIDEPDRHARHPDAGLLVLDGDAHVARLDEQTPARHRVAVHQGDGGRGVVKERAGGAVHRAQEAHQARPIDARERIEVQAAREGLAGAGDEERLPFGIFDGLLERLEELEREHVGTAARKDDVAHRAGIALRRRKSRVTQLVMGTCVGRRTDQLDALSFTAASVWTFVTSVRKRSTTSSSSTE